MRIKQISSSMSSGESEVFFLCIHLIAFGAEIAAMVMSLGWRCPTNTRIRSVFCLGVSFWDVYGLEAVKMFLIVVLLWIRVLWLLF